MINISTIERDILIQKEILDDVQRDSNKKNRNIKIIIAVGTLISGCLFAPLLFTATLAASTVTLTTITGIYCLTVTGFGFYKLMTRIPYEKSINTTNQKIEDLSNEKESHITQLDNQAKEIGLKGLKFVLEKTTNENKKFLFTKAYEKFVELVKELSLSLSVHYNDKYKMEVNKAPEYFSSNRILFDILSDINVLHSSEYYDYEKTQSYGNNNNAVEYEDYWVDFANKNLGGGTLGNGNVQEEIMFSENPELLEKVAEKKYKTRVLEDNVILPTPIIMKNTNRVIEFNAKKYYGSVFNKTPLSELINDVATSNFSEAQKLNILAMACPNLQNKINNSTIISHYFKSSNNKEKLTVSDKTTMVEKQYDASHVYDIFNTIWAGFEGVSEQKDGNKSKVIHTGLFGCGVFMNNKRLVYVLQRLAAKSQQVDIKFWGIPDDLKICLNNDYDAVEKALNEQKNVSILEMADIAIDTIKERQLKDINNKETEDFMYRM